MGTDQDLTPLTLQDDTELVDRDSSDTSIDDNEEFPLSLDDKLILLDHQSNQQEEVEEKIKKEMLLEEMRKLEPLAIIDQKELEMRNNLENRIEEIASYETLDDVE